MNKLKSIAVLTCWYGEYPWYFPYYVHSCSFNPTIDFYIITDNLDEIPYKPKNLIIINRKLEDIKDAASEKLGFTVNIDYPYKLCDFKPAYGFLFPEIIKDYDFWGQSDLDIIYGNVRDFITKEMLEEFDFISLRHDYVTGCFALYRNNNVMNTFFMRSKDYKKVFSDSKHYCFDECSFAWHELTEGASIFDLDLEVESFTHLIQKADQMKEIKAHFDFLLIEGLTGRITFDNGRIYFKNQFEGILYHLILFKKENNPMKIAKRIPDKYYISKTKIYHSR
ncbi:hypothetical protein SAMN06265349_10328 [Flavobacterium resistens]|uniref:Uncharacterized protein n=1 Tax=Flavobacterium resistens TaxID=443612 RepID=A0A521DB06_9FLAO|nr:DUF6625 family protein [Flavobacterium resistens]MRX70410.1 hypothetical protein [Flavobacterium resistens]SMO68261.1 hypothetical protein SAMN06265349_10328 [Flavobacterium resistens]